MGFDFFSPGCNCKAIFTLTGPCTGVLTWCTKPGVTVKVQKKGPGSTWIDTAIILPSDPQQYIINHSQTGTYRIQCMLCPGQYATSAEVTTQFCGNHSFWFRLARQSCTLLDHIICPNLPAYYALKTVIISGTPRRVVQCYNCLGQEIFPDVAIGAYVSLSVKVVSPTLHKLYSISHTAYNLKRVGYNFDYRYLGQSNYPTCGSSGSWFLYFNSPQGYGLYSMGGVTYTRQANLVWKLIGEGDPTGAPYWQDPTTPESGFWNEQLVQSANVSVWFNPYGAGNSSVGYSGPGVAWNDGTFMGTFDQTGNSLGIIYNDRVVDRTQTGTRPPTYANDYSAFGPDEIALVSPWPARRYGPEPLTEFKVRSCVDFSLGINPLPPGSVVNCPWNGAPWMGMGWLP